MNKNILQKCVEELKKETFSKEYVLGMLETMIEIDSSSVPSNPYSLPQNMPFGSLTVPGTIYTNAVQPVPLTEEELNARAYERGPAPVTI
jgi:hypothetical protein